MPCGRSGPAVKCGCSAARSTIAVRAVEACDSPTPPPPMIITDWSCAGGSSTEADVSVRSASRSPGTGVKVSAARSHTPGVAALVGRSVAGVGAGVEEVAALGEEERRVGREVAGGPPRSSFLVDGSKISFLPGMIWPMSSSPETASTLPSGRVTSVGYQRASFIGVDRDVPLGRPGRTRTPALMPWKSFLSRPSFGGQAVEVAGVGPGQARDPVAGAAVLTMPASPSWRAST